MTRTTKLYPEVRTATTRGPASRVFVSHMKAWFCIRLPSRISALPKARRRKSLCRRSRGFTILELTLVLGIVATLSGLTLPLYVGYLEKARVARSIAEIHTFQKAIDLYELTNGVLPENLVEAGIGSPLDPWGTPYEYLKLADDSTGGQGGIGGGNSGNNGGGNNGGGNSGNNGGGNNGNNGGGNGNCNGNSGSNIGDARKDRHLNPINSDYDLYSMGKNRDSKKPLQNPKSHDDVVRANDGSFVGLATDFWSKHTS